MTHVDHFAQHLTAQHLTQAQREAIIRLMVLTMYADKRLTLEENSVLTYYEQALKWESGISLRHFFSNVVAEVRKAMHDDDRRNRLVAEVCATLTANGVQALALKACNDMANADRDKTPDERLLLQQIAEALGST
jgi:uncharacterized tellurite resistance protein B-like protein